MAQDTEQVIVIPRNSRCVHSLACLNLPPCMLFMLDSKKRNTTRTTALIVKK